MRGALAAAALLPAAAAHGTMQMPPSWHDPDGYPGMTAASQCSGSLAGGDQGDGKCQWYSNWTHIVGKPAFDDDSYLVTFTECPGPDQFHDGGCATRPWRAPGSAPVQSPCGVHGANLNGCPVGNPSTKGCDPGGYGHGMDARDAKFPNVVATQWKAGAVVEAAWMFVANHGGGYSYRLCKKPAGGNKDLTEECFQKGALDFVGDMQWVQYGTDASQRTGFIANRTKTGTTPAGSQWTKNPIPACAGAGGGYIPTNIVFCEKYPWKPGAPVPRLKGTQFTPPAPGLWGWGSNFGAGSQGATKPGSFKNALPFSIVDRLQVPAALEPGDYALSFRWDCEQTPQVWNSCADVTIVA